LFFNQIHLAADLNSNINIYNINDGSLVSTLKRHSDRVNDLIQISDDLLASSSDYETVRIWNLTTNTCKFILEGHFDRVNGFKEYFSEWMLG
jgi:WD40 repeat protein